MENLVPQAPPVISVVIPVHNEEGNLRELHGRLLAALAPIGRSFEVVYVDDGSTDRSLAILRELAADTTPPVLVIEL